MKYFLLIALPFLVATSIADNLNAQNQSSPETILEQQHKEIFAHYDSLEKVLSKYADSLKMPTSNVTRTRVFEKVNAVTNFININRPLELETVDFDFIRKNPASPKALNLLYGRVNNKQCINGYDSFYYHFNILSDAIKNSPSGKIIGQELVFWKNSSVGCTAPDFKVRDLDNKKISLKDYRNKNYVILDFWGSHCGPCRRGMPYLKKLYGIYHKSGLEVIAISNKNDDINSVRNAISQDGTSIWKQVFQKDNADDVFSKYFVQPIPVRVLINKEGIIIGRWYGDSQENDTALSNKLQEAFEM